MSQDAFILLHSLLFVLAYIPSTPMHFDVQTANAHPVIGRREEELHIKTKRLINGRIEQEVKYGVIYRERYLYPTLGTLSVGLPPASPKTIAMLIYVL